MTSAVMVVLVLVGCASDPGYVADAAAPDADVFEWNGIYDVTWSLAIPQHCGDGCSSLACNSPDVGPDLDEVVALVDVASWDRPWLFLQRALDDGVGTRRIEMSDVTAEGALLHDARSADPVVLITTPTGFHGYYRYWSRDPANLHESSSCYLMSALLR